MFNQSTQDRVIIMKEKNPSLVARILAALLLSAAAGCAAVNPAGPETEAARPSVATNGEALLKAFRSNDATAFLAALPLELRGQFGQKEFEGARRSIGESLGEPVSYEYLATLEHPLLTVSLWKVRFERKDSEGKTVHQEAVFRVISAAEKDGFRVVSFNFL